MSASQWRLTMLVVAVLLAASGLGAGAQPLAALGVADQETAGTTVPYPGRLSDADGQPVADGAYELRFALYAAATGGQPLWTETQTGVAVRGGTFAVVLGSVVPIPKAVLDGSARWLEVSVRGLGEMTPTVLAPRQAIAPAATAKAASICEHTHFGEDWVDDYSPGYGLKVENNGSGDGIVGQSTDTRYYYAGVYGYNGSTGSGVYGVSVGGRGVYGSGVTGVFGKSESGEGVHGESANWFGVYGEGLTGVFGTSSYSGSNGIFAEHTGAGFGLTASSAQGFGMQAGGLDTSRTDGIGDILLAGSNGEIIAGGIVMNLFSNRHIWLDIDQDNNDSGATFRVYGGDQAILLDVVEPTGDLVTGGSQASAVDTKDYSQRLLYAVEGTGVWLEDVGTAALGQGGEVTVAFDPVYAQAANVRGEYQVFVTARSQEPVLLYVTATTAAGFTVRGVTLDGKPASCSFDYRVVAPRAGYEDTRLEQYTPEEEGQP